MFRKILIANRGEIADRIMAAAYTTDTKTVAIYSEADAFALHTQNADEAYQIGEGNELKDTYLNIEEIIKIAKKCGADAIHPGYGFLSENPDFVAACERENIIFIGPHTRAIQLMGNKIESRTFVKKLGIPMTEAVTGDFDELMKAADTIPFPLLIKAAAGGGGKGMRVVWSKDEMKDAIESTSREAGNYFGDPTVFVEKYVEEPRHIEIQVMGDNHGNVIHLYERECSIQRRHQKIIEESPSVTLTPEVREKMGAAAVRIAKEIEYNSAGTVEFLVDKDLNFYFLEMNTRIQVEHPVTEEVTGIDLVKEQISVAYGNKLSFKQEDIKQKGHAIECRIYAEDPANNFLPSPGYITQIFQNYEEESRMDIAFDEPSMVESFYDPMLGKMIVWGEDREDAIAKMNFSLRAYMIHGIKTNLSYLTQIINFPPFIENNISTNFCNIHTEELIEKIKEDKKEVPKEILACTYVAISLQEQQIKREEQAKNTSLSTWEQIGFWKETPMLSCLVDEEELDVYIENSGQNIEELTLVEETRKTEAHFLSSNYYQFKVNDVSFYMDCFTLEEDGYLHFLVNGENIGMFYYSDEKENILTFYGHNFAVARKDYLIEQDVFVSSAMENGNTKIVAPMPGKVIKINVKEEQEVKKGEVLLIVEAMKMENNIIAPKDGIVGKINVSTGDMVDGSLELVELNSTDTENN